MFEYTGGGPVLGADVDEAALAAVRPCWRVLVGRDRRPIGVRLAFSAAASNGRPPAMGALLEAMLASLTVESDGQPLFPQALVVLAPRDIDVDDSLSEWRAPRNVLLELSQRDLGDEARLRRLFEIQRQGARIALRLDEPAAPPSERLSYFQYLVARSHRELPPNVDPRAASVLTLDGADHAQVQAAFAAGVHAICGWPMTAMVRHEPHGLTPAQSAVFELLRLVQSDAELRDLERVFRGEPLLAYLLLTLANSAAFRRQTPVSSIGHAISLLGYHRLTKWLVLLLAIAGKDPSIAPLIFTAVVRGHLLDGLCAAGGRARVQRDEAFVVGVFSLLDAITGQSLRDLLQDVHLADPIVDALLGGAGPYAPLLELAKAFEQDDTDDLPRAWQVLGLAPEHANAALFKALAAADSLQGLIQ